MIRLVFAIPCVVVLLAAPGVSWAQSDTMSYSDTMRKHGKSAAPTHAAKQGTASALRLKSGKKSVAKKGRGSKV
jgi:hypothetical protein